MGTLTIKKGHQGERAYPLLKERVKIGRSPECDIYIDDPSMSLKHAMIITLLNDSFVQDTGSTNGTFVNGDSVEKQELNDGDIIKVGNLEIVYRKDEYDETDFEKTIVVQRVSTAFNEGSAEQTKAIEEAEDEARKSAVDETKNTKRCFLRLIKGPAADKNFEVKKSLVTLGRPGIQVAVISRRPQGYFFTHVEGAGNNYPLINNEPTGPDACLLNNHDVIELAGVQIQVIISD